MRNPINVLPNPIDSTWDTTVRRTTAASAEVGARMFNATAQTIASGLATTTSPDYVALSTSNVTLPAGALTNLDTRPSVPTGSAGRVASSVLRLVLSLRDVTAPEFLSQLSNPDTAFSPGASLGSKDTTTFSARIKDFSPVDWTLTIKDASGQTVRSHSVSNLDARSGPIVSWTWDGRDSSGLFVADGTYTATMTASDVQGNTSTSPAVPLPITVDTVAPTISDYAASPNPFNPEAADPSLRSTTITANVSEPSSWTVSIAGADSVGSGVSVDVSWDGLGVPDGDHAADLTVIDMAGNNSMVNRDGFIGDSIR